MNSPAKAREGARSHYIRFFFAPPSRAFAGNLFTGFIDSGIAGQVRLTYPTMSETEATMMRVQMTVL